MSDTPLNDWSQDLGHPKPLESLKVWDRGNYVTVTKPPDARDMEIERLNAELALLTAEVEQLTKGIKGKDRALSAIDYALGEPNEMECSLYDVDYDEERVVRKVIASHAEAEGLRIKAARWDQCERMAERFTGATGATFWELQPQQGETFAEAIDDAIASATNTDDGGRTGDAV